jgi:hypothetical protein
MFLIKTMLTLLWFFYQFGFNIKSVGIYNNNFYPSVLTDCRF